MVRILERVLEDNKQAVAMQPDLIDVALVRADTALDWSEDEREAQRTAFDKDLAQRLLRADIPKATSRRSCRNWTMKIWPLTSKQRRSCAAKRKRRGATPAPPSGRMRMQHCPMWTRPLVRR